MLCSSPSFVLAIRALPIAFSILLLVAVILNGFSLNDDPYRCKALLGDGIRNGSWLHHPDSNGDRKPFTNWQPDGCMLHKYTSDDIRRCMDGRYMVFSGDSTTRQVYWGMARLINRKKAVEAREHIETHESHELTLDGIQMRMVLNPWFLTGELNPELTRELELFTKEKHHPLPIKEQQGPAIVMLGAGSWYALVYTENQSFNYFQEAFDNITDILHLKDLPPFGTRSMDPHDGVGNEVFIAPVAPPFYESLPESRTRPEGIHEGEVEAIDQYILDAEAQHNLRLLRAFPELSRNQPGAMVDLYDTGFHVIDSVAEIKANILLNLRCNAKLDKLSGYPYDRTCCSDYGSRSFAQIVVLGLTGFYTFACIVFEIMDIVSFAENPRRPWLNMKIGVFPMALLYCYVADRTDLFSKGMKEFATLEFALLVAVYAIVFAATIRRTRLRVVAADATITKPIKEDAGILSRDQTEEWKGWMQAAILIYHWTGASRNLPVYMFIRLLVAAYLFQTGYGHTIFFLAKKDFSPRRIANVLLRLNMLSCALPYIMDTDYMFYYFAPLVSFWFLVVYATMGIGSRYNDSTYAVISKICGSLVLVTVILKFTPVMEWVFVALKTIFRIKWDLHEWEFRINLDSFIVYVGMLAGVAHQRMERNSTWFTNYRNAIAPSLAILMICAVPCLIFCDEKRKYTMVHPYLSFLPVLAFVALRNATSRLRNMYSTAAAWLGRCSLETFILQYHIYLAGDTKGVLLFGFFKGDGSLLSDRWRDLVIIVPVFLWMSNLVADASGAIVKLTMHKHEEISYDEDDELKIIEPTWGNYILLDGHRLGRLNQVLGTAIKVASDPRLRIASIVALMWLLNWLY
ncbi:uncharacterized protein NECHADRAFT_88136 [Fusarium vanettenii 77-13-4]|uniref:Cas1p 10 TM acyl transferase domain-containing protein n=1 Tax=Fusarium vanettenii (strain ATCC MYA-4622 / CBS 123669 / FGSC 9596 / NRRL 45880 / 77-13-4) TaxID=660122 RepID=C7ZDU6_FUSV7|nr:uncharacterized protein NECHADRAFT_88136 [Fusarium vanettenii 77-13-4]EEU37754.1 hypothetical protein NECHADRAFT_88136 [Fusarium vanettenii 77-13-4]